MQMNNFGNPFVISQSFHYEGDGRVIVSINSPLNKYWESWTYGVKKKNDKIYKYAMQRLNYIFNAELKVRAKDILNMI